MKTCTYCGKEYPDDSVLCPVDGNPLSKGGSDVPENTKTLPPVLPPPLPRAVWTDRQIRTFELFLICTIAFGSSILLSTASVFGYIYHNPTQGALSWSARILLQASVLGLLWYILLRRGKTFSDLDMTWTGKDFVWSLIIYLLASYSRHAFYQILYFSGLTAINLKTTSEHIGQFLFGGSILISTMLFQFINPFF